MLNTGQEVLPLIKSPSYMSDALETNCSIMSPIIIALDLLFIHISHCDITNHRIYLYIVVTVYCVLNCY